LHKGDWIKSVVIAFGGSLLNFDREYFEKFRKFIIKLSREYKIYLVVGGGKTARNYIKFGREMGVSEEKLDRIGIDATRLNARLISCILDANNIIPESVEDAVDTHSPVVVMGGTLPGHSTDAVAAELAYKSGADILVIATDVKGIYDKDPKKHSDAVLYNELYVEDLIDRYGTEWRKAGENVVIDGPALDIIRKATYRVVVVDGRDIENMEMAIRGKDFVGTKIKRRGA